MVSPWLIAVPVAGAAALFFLMQPVEAAAEEEEPKYEPPPSGPYAAPEGVSGGPRFREYMKRLDVALAAWRAVSMIPVAEGAQRTLMLGTVDVVRKMAEDDRSAGRITEEDFLEIVAKVKEIKAEIEAKEV